MNINSVDRESSREDVYVLNNRRNRNGEEEKVEQIRSLDEIVTSLQREKSLADKLSEPGNEFEVKTYIKVNNREWYFSSYVLHNGEELKDIINLNLIRHEQRRKPVPRSDKTEARWDAFVQEAAKIHLVKWKEVKKLIDRPEKHPPSTKKLVLIIVALFSILAAAAIGTYWFYFNNLIIINEQDIQDFKPSHDEPTDDETTDDEPKEPEVPLSRGITTNEIRKKVEKILKPNSEDKQ